MEKLPRIERIDGQIALVFDTFSDKVNFILLYPRLSMMLTDKMPGDKNLWLFLPPPEPRLEQWLREFDQQQLLLKERRDANSQVAREGEGS
jgi:hypothetical protein